MTPLAILLTFVVPASRAKAETPPKSSEPLASRAPQWVDFGRDDRRRRLWVRVQRDPRTDSDTLIEFYADGHLVKSKSIDSESFFLDGVPATMATIGGRSLLFYDSHPGAGDTWFTNYLVIRPRDLRFEKLGQFEHGDPSNFQSTRRFYEYNLLKYQGDYRFRRLGVTGYKVVEWLWNPRRARFTRIRHWYRAYLPDRLQDAWYDQPHLRLHGVLVGQQDDFRPAEPTQYGLPKDSHFWIQPWHGIGDWTVGLVAGKTTYDELNLIHGLKTLAGLDYPIGELDPHNPPRLVRSRSGLVLVLTTCAFRKIRVSKFVVTTKPYKIRLLETRIEPAWTPFQAKDSDKRPARASDEALQSQNG